MKGKSSFDNEEIIQMVFDSFCKKVLKKAAFDCFREIQKHREREQFFQNLPRRSGNRYTWKMSTNWNAMFFRYWDKRLK